VKNTLEARSGIRLFDAVGLRMGSLLSYRAAHLSNTHEIGMSRTKMREHLREVGFTNALVLRNRLHGFYRPHWLAARCRGG
jgi:hypothetical protein